MTIVFDLNRTLYDPVNNSLYSGVHKILETFREKNILMHVLSRKEFGRERILHEHGVGHFFTSVTLVEEKTQASFRSIFETQRIDFSTAYVVGDYLHEDIRYGNQCGAKTIWVKQGKISNLKPECAEDIPWKTVSDIKEIVSLVGV